MGDSQGRKLNVCVRGLDGGDLISASDAPGSLLLSRLMNEGGDQGDAGVLMFGSSLKLSNSSLGPQGCTRILQAVQENSTVTEINLAGCNISRGDELAEIVKQCHHLQRLLLEGNCLGLARTGLSSLASAIALSSTLKEVDLRNNRIGPSFAAVLANALRSTRSLAFLDLRWNSLGPGGAAAFINLLQKNPVITGIQLSGNGIPQKLLSEIDKIVEENRTKVVLPQLRPHIRHPLEDDVKPVNREGMDAIYSGRIAALVEELDSVKAQMEVLKKERDDVKLEILAAEHQTKAIRLEITEEALLRKYADKEANEIKEQLIKTQQELARAQERIQESERVQTRTLAAQNAALAEAEKKEKAAHDMHAAAVLECNSLKEKLLRSQNEFSDQLQSLEEKVKAELQNNLVLVKAQEQEISKINETHAREVNMIRVELTCELKRAEGENHAALQEVERLKSMALALETQCTAREKNIQQEKVAAEQLLNARLAGAKSEQDSLQVELENVHRELVKARKKHTAELEEYETAIAQQRTLQHRLELTKSDLEEKIFTLTGEKVQLQERSKLAEDRERLLEKKVELERLKYSEQASGEISRHLEDKKRLENELHSTRIQLHSTRSQLEELHAEQEKRKLEVEKRVLGIETAFIDWTRQQFAGLRSSQPRSFTTASSSSERT